MIRVGDLRKAIEGLPDDAPIFSEICGGEILGFHDDEVDIEFHEASPFNGGIVLKIQVSEYWDDDDDFDDEYIFEDDDDESEDLD